MILDGNTDWSPDEDGHVIDGADGRADNADNIDNAVADGVIDQGATVGIGPLPSPSTGEKLDAAEFGDLPGPGTVEDLGTVDLVAVDGLETGPTPGPSFGPLVEPADRDRPPMVTGPFLPDEGTGTEPYGWVATGPLPADAGVADPLPTGPIPVTLPAGAAAAPTARVFLQAGVVLVAAAVVGLVVFGVLRSAVGDRSGTEEADLDRSNGTSLDPGPGDPGGNGDLLGSKRGTAGLGQQRDEENGSADAPDGTSAQTGETPGGDGERASSPGDPAGPTTVVERSGPPTTASGRSGPPTTVAVDRLTTSITSGVNTTNSVRRSTTTAVTSTRPTTTVTRRSTTTNPSTTRPGSTTTIAQTTTTRASTTTTISLPARLIAAPASGSVRTWESQLTLRANPVPGVSEYCWTLSGTAGETTHCRSATSTGHAASSRQPGPGAVTIEAEARAADGRVIMSQRISITLLARNVITAPSAGSNHELGDRLRLAANRVPGANRYCWSLTQGATSSGQLCGANRNRNLNGNRPPLSDFAAGPVTVRITAERNGVVVGRQAFGIEFTGR